MEMCGSDPVIWECMGAAGVLGVHEVPGIAGLPLVPAHVAVLNGYAARVTFPYSNIRWTMGVNDTSQISVLGGGNPSCAVLRALYPHGMVFFPSTAIPSHVTDLEHLE